MALYRFGEHRPQVAASAYVAKEATVIGQVTLGEEASVWPAAVIRADNEPIVIGAGTSVQDGAILHVDVGTLLNIGKNVTIGHQAMLHGCTVGDDSMIGIQAIIMNKAVIGKSCIVGAGSVVPTGKIFPDRSLILGSPAKVLREVTDEEIEFILWNADDYIKRQRTYKTNLHALD
jgi:carbonic anhydrase/acetyltransferase-like protein (isoleucine patch superfamily)